MPHRHSPSLSNPMLGILFGIFASCLVAIVILLLIFEQLGLSERALKGGMALGAMGLFAFIGAGSHTNRMREFASANRRVPAFYNGLTLMVVALGGAGLAGLAGALFLAGFDMLFLGLGLIAGLTAQVMLIAPFLRKFGTSTVPGFLGLRFESGPVRLLAASIVVVPLLLVVVAEIKMAMMAAGGLMGLGSVATASVVVAALIATLVPGGVRSLSWSSAAQALAVLGAVLVPTAIAAVMLTNLPFGQLSHGPLLRAVARLEAAQAVQLPIARIMAFEIPGAGLQAITGRYDAIFGSVGPLAFVLATLSIMAGVAGSPALLGRAGATPSVFATRKSIGWSVVLVGVLLTTFSAIAVFERHILATAVTGALAGQPPAGVRDLITMGLAAIDPRQPKFAVTSLLVNRDATLIALPVLLGLPQVVISLMAIGILSAALAAAAASLAQVGLVLGEDVVMAPDSWRLSEFQRVTTCRVAVAVVAVVCGVAAVLVPGDPLMLLLHALAISGSTMFPILVLAIWWKRVTGLGALAGLAVGFATALVVFAASGMAGLGLPGVMAPIAGVPLAIAAAVVVSQLTGVPGRHILEMVRDMRVPGRETLYDRELRQARQRGSHHT